MSGNGKKRWMERLAQFIKYGFAGGISTAVNLLLFWILEGVGLYYIAANVVSYVFAVVLNYVMNRKFVFAQRGDYVKKEERRRLAKFMFIRLLNLLADNGLFYLCVSIFGMPVYPSRLGLTFAEIVVTYAAVKKMVF